MSQKTALVTGACGEIGQALVQGLHAASYRIVTTDLFDLKSLLAKKDKSESAQEPAE